MKNYILKITFLSFFLILISCGGGGEDCGDIDTSATTPESSDFKDIIEQFNSSYSNLNSTNEFIEQPKVINGASDLIKLVFDESGLHTRAAVSTNSLPLGVSVEVDAIFELN